MKVIYKISFISVLTSILLFFYVHKIEAAQNYVLETGKIIERQTTLDVTVKNSDKNFSGVVAKINGESYYGFLDDGIYEIEFPYSFKEGTEINIYVQYTEDNSDGYTKKTKEEYIKTIKVEKAEPYSIKVKNLGDSDDTLYFTIENMDSSLIGIYAEVNGKYYDAYINRDEFDEDSSKKSFSGSIDLGKPFKVGTEIKLYASYFMYNESDENWIDEYIKSITVSDKTPPKIKVPSISTRSTSVQISTEKDAKVEATYGGKKAKVVKKSATTFQISIKKPILGKKLVIVAMDAAGNNRKVSKTTTKPSGVSISLNEVKTKTRTATGTVKKSIAGDKVYFVIGSKKYKGTIKNGKYSVKIPGIKARKYVKVKLYDKYGNLLATSDERRVFTTYTIHIGMTKKEVLDTYWGSPNKINTTIVGNSRYEQWIYYNDYYSYDRDYLYFTNGKLTSIQQY